MFSREANKNAAPGGFQVPNKKRPTHRLGNVQVPFFGDPPVDILSPTIMVQWKITLNERKLILEIHPFSTSMIMGGRAVWNGPSNLPKHLVDGFVTSWCFLDSSDHEDLTIFCEKWRKLAPQRGLHSLKLTVRL